MSSGRSAVRARAEIEARAGDDGRTRVVVLRSEAPLLLRSRRDAGGPDGCVAHLVGGAAGPLAGDRLTLAIRVGPGARLTLHSVAATIALPGRSTSPSRLHVTAQVGAGGSLAVLPEPTVAAGGCRHEIVADVTMEDGAGLVWRDELLLGRHGEAAGDLSVALRVDVGGRPLLRQQLEVGPSAAGSNGPAVLGGARAVGTVLLAGTAVAPCTPYADTGLAVLPLAGQGVLVSALAGDAVTLRRRLDAGTAAVTEPYPATA